jgi:tetratricopeptide (TPR) repeat protein/tRNA A-37 threonylcarbamoyl transferase component Bud32
VALNQESPDGTLVDLDRSDEEIGAVLAELDVESDSSRPHWTASILTEPEQKQREAVQLEPGFLVPGTRYNLVGWLGDGGMGVVYEAEHIDLERRVALKVIREKYCKDKELKEMFRSEARAASRVGADQIVQIYDFAELPDGRLAFAMEVLRGRLLKQHIKDGVIPAPRAIGILRQVCKGLTAAHDANVIHRDVKPGNVVLEIVKGRADTVKILDFGIASIRTDAGHTQDRGGTPFYVAPELILGHPADERSDIYSLGCTAFEMLIGHPPFKGSSAKEVLLKHLEDPAPDPRSLREGIPNALADVIMRCLEKAPGDRYADMRDLEAALCEAQVEEKLDTSWDDLPLPEVEAARKDKLLRAMPDPSRLRRKDSKLVPILAGGGLLAATIVGAMFALQPSAAELSEIDQLTVAARAQAAHAYWVYPPPDEPKHATAYTNVLAIEDIGGGQAQDAAHGLRVEFADTLSRLGDEYWEREGGKPFAIDYYAQVLVFEPDDPTASERARMTPGQLAVLQEKAEDQSFSEDELIAVEPLAVLAEEDPEEQQKGLRELARKDRALAGSTQANLEALTGKSMGPEKANEPVVVAQNDPQPEAAEDPVDDEVLLDEEGEEDGGEEIEDIAAPPSGKVDSGRASGLAKRGATAFRSGKTAEAESLFKKALAADDRNAKANIGLAQVYFERGAYAKAARYGRKAVRIRPRNAAYRIKLGDYYYKAFKYKDAKKQYKEAKKLGHASAQGRLDKVAAKLGG